MSIPRTAGASVASESLSSNLSFYTVVTLIDIEATGDFSDNSQKNFETLINGISLRCQPVIFNNPIMDANAALVGYSFGSSYSGNANVWTWKFCTEHPGALTVAMLEAELDSFPIINIADANNVIFGTAIMNTASATLKNIYFVENDLL